MKTLALINPLSDRGRTAGRWPGLSEELGQAIGAFDAAFTRRPMDAAELAREALKSGYRRLVVVGGDGTLNEAVNGLFDDGAIVNREAVIGLIRQGTGGDFRRTLGLPRKPSAAVAAIRRGRVRRIDLGKATFVGPGGAPVVRYFVNVASFGMSGAVSKSLNEAGWSKRLGGSVAFYLATAATMIGHRNVDVGLTIDGRPADRSRVNTVAVCNGAYFGGGMKVAPMAEPDDGCLDVVVLGDFGLWDFIADGMRLYQGRHLALDQVTVDRGRRIEAGGADAMPLEVDGEPVGTLPATFEIVPGVVDVIA